ncbi:hypothetical protein HK098_001599 [Nowakowskiella sp. JEL0407]|nr:hypothetical protein HK098_001599 [Nowakowskiella sp. JEL0407]
MDEDNSKRRKLSPDLSASPTSQRQLKRQRNPSESTGPSFANSNLVTENKEFSSYEEEISFLRSENEKLNKTVAKLNQDVKSREATLLMKLAKKEEEVQDLISELNELTREKTLESDTKKRKLIDPSIQLLWKAMKKEVEEKDEKISSLESELNGVLFTPTSITGKRLISKMRSLQAENDELGKLLFKGKVEQMNVEVSLHKKMVHQLKEMLQEADQFVVQLDGEVESMQSTVFNLQSKLDGYERKNKREDVRSERSSDDRNAGRDGGKLNGERSLKHESSDHERTRKPYDR